MRTRRPGFRWFDLPTHVRYGLACAAFALSGCAADWRDRSLLSAVDTADLATLHVMCVADTTQSDVGRQEQAQVCADITHRLMCHARVGACP